MIERRREMNYLIQLSSLSQVINFQLSSRNFSIYSLFHCKEVSMVLQSIYHHYVLELLRYAFCCDI